MTLPEGTIGRLLALGLCGLILVSLQALVVRPLLSLYDGMQGELGDLQMQRARLSHLEAEMPKLKARVLALKQQSRRDSPLLPETSDAMAAAGLQTRLQGIAKSKGVEISSVESLPPRAKSGFRRIGVRVVLRADLPALTAILQALGESRPPLFVDNLEIRNSISFVPQRSDASPVLNVGLYLYGYRLDNMKTAEAR